MATLTENLAAHETMLAISAATLLVGAWLCWIAPRSRMSVEEHVKDGQLTADDGRRKIRAIEIRGPAVTIFGVALLAFALLR